MSLASRDRETLGLEGGWRCDFHSSPKARELASAWEIREAL